MKPLALGLLLAASSAATFPHETLRSTLLATLVLASVFVVLGLRWPGGGAAALALATPLLPSVTRLLGDKADPPILLVVACAATGAIVAGSPGDSPLPASLRRWATLFLVVAFVSALSSIVRGETLFFLLRGGVTPHPVNALGMLSVDRTREAVRAFAVYALIPLALDAFARAMGRARKPLLLAASLGAAAAFALAALETRLPFPLTDPWWTGIGRRSGTFTDPNSLGIGLAILVPILLAALPVLPRASRIAPLAALALAPVALQRSGSRTGLLLLLVALAALSIGAFRAFPKARLPIAGAAAAGLVLALLAWRFAPRGGSVATGGLFERIGAAFSAASLEDLSSHRPLFWRTAFEILEEEPLSGCGLGGFPFEFPWRYERRHTPVTVTDNATNTLLDVGAECGIPALLLALAAVVPLLVRALDAALSGARELDPASRAGGAALVGLAVASITGSHVRFPEIALLAAFAASLVPVREEPLADEHGFTPPRRLPVLLAATGALAAILAIGGTRRAESAFRSGPWVGVYSWEKLAENRYHRWMGPRAFRRVLPGETRVSMDLSNERPDGKAVTVTADVDGGLIRTLTLQPGETRALVLDGIPKGAEAIRLRFDPTFVPFRLTGRRDLRELSVTLFSSSEERVP